MKLVLTCEHAGNLIPEKFNYLFIGNDKVLDTHRGYDPGAFDLLQHLKELSSYQKSQMESRLLIEVNRSLHHAALFSEFTRDLSREIKQQLITEFYQPYRKEVENTISRFIKNGEEILHLSIHSFTPQLNGIIRNADIGLLYDPARNTEKDFCKALKMELLSKKSSYRIRANYPYRGTADGFTTSLRRMFPGKYSGIEIEVNQKYAIENKMDEELKSNFLSSLQSVIPHSR